MIYSYMFCLVSALRNFGLGFLQTKHLANSDQWKDGNAGERYRYRECYQIASNVYRSNAFLSVNDGSLLAKATPAAEQPNAMQCASPYMGHIRDDHGHPVSYCDYYPWISRHGHCKGISTEVLVQSDSTYTRTSQG